MEILMEILAEIINAHWFWFGPLFLVGLVWALIRRGPYVDARAYGDALTDVTIQAAITAIGANKRVLRITPGTWVVNPTDATIEVPDNITLKVDRGALLSVSAGKTLTINGPLEAGLYGD